MWRSFLGEMEGSLMKTTVLTQRIVHPFDRDDYILLWIDAFMTDRKSRGLAGGSLRFYMQKLHLFSLFCECQAVTQIRQIDAAFLRKMLIWLEETGHNPGGVHGCYRAVRAFLFWWEEETEPVAWKNPITKVRAPKVPDEPLDPVEFETVKAMVATCKGRGFTDYRDKAIFYALLDTGARATEFRMMDIDDLDLAMGSILIRQGKGRKPRMVYLAQKSRQAVRAYLKTRRDGNPALWVTDEGGRLSYDGLRGVVKRRANLAEVEQPTLHDFRRAFALNMLRAGVDIFTVQRLMGHTSLVVLKRYLALTDQDTKAAHMRGSPVDHWKF